MGFNFEIVVFAILAKDQILNEHQKNKICIYILFKKYKQKKTQNDFKKNTFQVNYLWRCTKSCRNFVTPKPKAIIKSII